MPQYSGYSNCFVWAVLKWFKEGGYVAWRWSYCYPGPHFLWSPDLVFWYEFTPPTKRRRLIPPLLYKGVVERVSS